jgi:2-polyprenyl-3-methyl-5-hydroxy-6-metoxy-1,4-benzoquinol methylase
VNALRREMGKTYPIAVREIHNKVRQIIAAIYPDGKGLCALDAASGNGYMSEWLHEKGFEVTALDKATSSWKVNGVKCSCADLDQDLRIKDSIFDLTISIETIEHLENPFHFIRELSRVTKDNGVIIISTPNTHSIRSRVKYLFCGMPVLFECIKDDNMGQHITPISMGQFLYAFGRTDVKLTDVFSVGSKSSFMVTKTLA